jgi:hypothetical protein
MTDEAEPMMLKVPGPVLVKTEFAALVLSVAAMFSILTQLHLPSEVLIGYNPAIRRHQYGFTKLGGYLPWRETRVFQGLRGQKNSWLERKIPLK